MLSLKVTANLKALRSQIDILRLERDNENVLKRP